MNLKCLVFGHLLVYENREARHFPERRWWVWWSSMTCARCGAETLHAVHHDG